MEEFEYEPLDLEKPAIRLLRLHPEGGSMIFCELFQAELHQRDNMVSYEALSYTWGSSHLSVIINVNDCSLKITYNLYRALLDLRYQERQRVLWIDAVCIDQGNDKERGHQVGQMGSIYKEAESVIFRLGLGSDARDIFMESLERLQEESRQHACRAWSRQDSRWEDLWICSSRAVLEQHHASPTKLRQGLQEILDQPWFRRVWILQEAAFAKAGIISCGTKSVSARLFGLTPLLLGITPDAHCQSVLDIMPSPWRESTWWSESRSFYKLLFTFGGSEATDPRDLVYALRGMSSDLADKYDDSLFPDYGKSQEKLVHDVFQYIYAFDAGQLKLVLHLSSMRELVINLPRLETDIVRRLAEVSQPEYMEIILQRPEILVSQDMIKAAAQYDRNGKVVKVLLRCRGGEFKIDHEVLLSAAANLNASKEVFEAFWSHQNQLIITQQILIATAENRKFSCSAMRFLLSLKTQDFDITPVLVAVSRNPSKYVSREIIEMLLQHKTQDFDVSRVLAVVSRDPSEYVSREIVERLLQHKTQDDSDSILAALSRNPFEYVSREIIGILLQQKGNSDDTISEILTVAAGIKDCGHFLLGDFVRENPKFEISRDGFMAAMGYLQRDTNHLEVLYRYFPSLIESSSSKSPDEGLNANSLLLHYSAMIAGYLKESKFLHHFRSRKR